MPQLQQRFSSTALYLSELERISKRWVAQPAPQYDVDPEDLPRSFGRITRQAV